MRWDRATLAALGLYGLAFVVAMTLVGVAAWGRDPDGRYKDAPHAAWFAAQYNKNGQWCCDVSDGHPFYEDYSFAENGDVEFIADGVHYRLPAYMVLTGPNPTGHAVWWFVVSGGERTSFCFAPGSAG